MRKIKSKKGSHVEVVISFAIFVIFLVFLYSVLEPAIRKPKSKEYILESIKPKLISYISEKIYSYKLEIQNLDNSRSCFEIQNSYINKNATVKSGTEIKDCLYYFDESNRGILSISDDQENTEYIIFTSSEFPKGQATTCSLNKIPECSTIATSDVGDGNEEEGMCYNIFPRKTEDAIFKSKIQKMKEEYETAEGMSKLKNILRIPSETNFWFNVTDIDRKQLIAPEPPKIREDINIYSEEIPIDFIDEKNDPENKQKGFLTIRIW